MSTGENRDRFIDSVFGDRDAPARDQLDGRDRVELHELEDLRTLLTDHGHREPPAQRRAELWSRLEARLDENRPRRRQLELRPSRNLLAAAAVVLLAIVTVALLRGRTPAPERPDAATRTAAVAVEDRSIADTQRLDALIDGATPLLMAVSNRSRPDQLRAVDIRSEQRLATSLADGCRALRESPDNTLKRRDRNLLAELETVLLQIANTEPSTGGGEIALLRRTIEDRQILFEFALRELTRTDAAAAPERSHDA